MQSSELGGATKNSACPVGPRIWSANSITPMPIPAKSSTTSARYPTVEPCWGVSGMGARYRWPSLRRNRSFGPAPRSFADCAEIDTEPSRTKGPARAPLLRDRSAARLACHPARVPAYGLLHRTANLPNPRSRRETRGCSIVWILRHRCTTSRCLPGSYALVPNSNETGTFSTGPWSSVRSVRIGSTVCTTTDNSPSISSVRAIVWPLCRGHVIRLRGLIVCHPD